MLRRVLLLLLLLTGIAPAQAGSPFDTVASGSELLKVFLQLPAAHEEMLQEAFHSVSTRPEQFRDVMKTKRPLAATAFHPTSPPLMPEVLARRFRATGSDHQAAKQLFNLCLQAYAKVANQLGLKPNDVAEAVAVCLGNNYYICTGKDLDRRQLAAVSRTVRVALARTGFSHLRPSDKQAMYELMAIVGIFPSLGIRVAHRERDASLALHCRQMARATFQALMGVDPEKVHFTDSGMTIGG